MPYNKADMKYKKANDSIGFPCLLFLVLLISVIIAIQVVPQTLAAQVTMDVTQSSDGTVFAGPTNLNIFTDYINGDKALKPGSTGSYTFEVYNTAASTPIDYSIKLTAKNPDNIPLKFSVEETSGNYIYGTSSSKNLLTVFTSPEFSLAGNATDTYALYWEWDFHVDSIEDGKDTILGSNAYNGTANDYTLIVEVTGSMDESSGSGGNYLPTTEDTSQPTTEDTSRPTTEDTSQPTTEDISQPTTEGTSQNKPGDSSKTKPDDDLLSRIGKILRPKTGDSSNVWIWIVILCISLIMILWLLLYKRREKDEDNEDNHKNK